MENEADRIARKKAQQKKEKEEEETLKARQAATALTDSYIHKIEVQIPIVLRLLEEHGYRFVEEVEIYEEFESRWHDWLFSSPHKTYRKGGWKIGQYKQDYYDSFIIAYVYMLSDGRICDGCFVTTLRKMAEEKTARFYDADEILRSCINGLNRLREQLEHH